MRITELVVAFLMLTAALYAVEVDVDELESTVTDTVSFINYTGVQTDGIDTIDAIRGIGVSLSEDIDFGESVVYAQRYRVTHVAPSENGLRGADLLELLPGARVDHIDNLRRIISSYLENRYGYSLEDARLLGQLVTIYNAVHRGNLDLFLGRYTEGLHGLLEEERVGLSLRYSEWPGFSQIIIPISVDASRGELSSVPADELLDEAVEETLRAADDLGLNERIEAADLIDRVVDEERSQIEEEQAAIDRERTELENEQAAIQDTIANLEEQREQTDPGSPERRALDEQIAEEEALLEENLQDQEDLSDRQVLNDTREETVAAADERSAELRDSLVDDIASSSNPQPDLAPLLITRSRISGDNFYSTIVRIDMNGGNVILTAEQEIIGRNYLSVGNGLLAIGEVSGAPSLVLFEKADLSMLMNSDTEVSRYSPLVDTPGGNIYAVIKEGNDWYAGRFDRNLNVLSRSSIPVSEGSALIIEDGKLFIQRKDGRFTGLDLTELKVSR